MLGPAPTRRVLGPAHGQAAELDPGERAELHRDLGVRVVEAADRPARAGATPGQAGVATQVGSSRWSVASGSEPWPRTASWNARRSNADAVACRDLAAQRLDLALADLVGQRLAGPADVAVGLDHRVGLRQPGRAEEVDRALARPAQGVEPGVDDEPGRAPGLRVEHPEPLGLVAEEAHLVGQPLAVQAPALDVGAADAARAEPPERDEVRVLHLERDLEVVPGHGLVIGRRAPASCTCGSAGRSRWRSRCPGASRRRTAGSSRRTARPLLVLLDRADLARRLGEDAEVARRERHRPLDVLGRRGRRARPSSAGVFAGSSSSAAR